MYCSRLWPKCSSAQIWQKKAPQYKQRYKNRSGAIIPHSQVTFGSGPFACRHWFAMCWDFKRSNMSLEPTPESVALSSCFVMGAAHLGVGRQLRSVTISGACSVRLTCPYSRPQFGHGRSVTPMNRPSFIVCLQWLRY